MPRRRRPTSPAQTPPTYRSERTGDRRFRFRIDAQDEASTSQSEAAAGRGVRPTTRVRRKRPVILDSEDEQDSNSAASTASFRLASSPSLTPPPPEDTPPPPPPPLDRDSSSIDAPQLPQAVRPIAGDTSYNPPERNADGSRRYTAKEKGKGKAGAKTANPPGNVPENDVSGGEECIEVIDVTQDGRSRKRKREEKAKLAASEVVEVGSSQGSDGAQMKAGAYAEKASVPEKEPEVKDRRKVGVEEDKALASYSELELTRLSPASVANASMPDLLLRTRPARHHSMVGYVHVNKPIVTNRSGHVTCAKCLLDALLAAIKRNPDPTPGRNHWNPRGRGRGANRSRGRGTHNPSHHSSRGPTHPLSYPMGGPAEWTTEALKAVWLESKEREYHRGLLSHGMEEKNWAVSRELDEAAPREETTYITEELKGLWALDGVAYVVEGECPVSRRCFIDVSARFAWAKTARRR